MKSELFAQILAIVAQITELTTEQILSKTKTNYIKKIVKK